MSARLVRAGLLAVAAGAVVLAVISGPVDTAADGLGAATAISAPDLATAPSAAGDAREAATEPAAGARAAPGAATAAAASAPASAAQPVASAPSTVHPANAASAATPGASAPLRAAAAASSAASAALAAAAPASAATSAVVALGRTRPCRLLAAKLPNLSEALCDAAQLQASGWNSVEGFPLYQRDVGSAAKPMPVGTGASRPQRRLRVLVLGAIHGDEISSASLVFHWIGHAHDTGADMDWRFVPAVNPDGLLRKTPTRTNARGIDLNRNFPTPHWYPDALDYWNKRTKQDARRYPGPEPLSEPESRFVTHTIDSWKPDAIISVHAPFGVLDYDGPSVPPERLGRLFLDRVGIYPGSLGNFGGAHRGVPVVTIELPNASRTPTDAEMRQMWIDLLRWMSERLSPIER